MMRGCRRVGEDVAVSAQVAVPVARARRREKRREAACGCIELHIKLLIGILAIRNPIRSLMRVLSKRKPALSVLPPFYCGSGIRSL